MSAELQCGPLESATNRKRGIIRYVTAGSCCDARPPPSSRKSALKGFVVALFGAVI